MLLKRRERRKNGKGHTYWALVESYRTSAGSRHRVVAYLGEWKRSEQSGWAQLCRRLNPEDRPAPSLFDPPCYAEPLADEPVLVKLTDIRLERLRDFGDVWLALGLWRLLKLDVLLAERMAAGAEDVPWPVVAAILTIARLCEPSSELHIADTWYGRTALDDLLGVAVGQVHHRRLYEGLDALLPHKQAIEAHLKQRLGDLFDLKYDLLLYDITSTYFEGPCQNNPMARRGYSRDSRPDCLQVCIGLVVTTDGIPLGYEVFDGKAKLSITWTRNERWKEWSALSEGCYLLRTNLTETDPAVLWKRYIQLTEAEWAFRIAKDEPAIRPIWHHKQDRVKAHILVCFLAYVMWKALAQWMRAAGLGDAPRTPIEELAKIKSGDVLLKARSADGRDHAIRLRCVTTPDKPQKILLNRLGLTLPQRLRSFDEVVQL